MTAPTIVDSAGGIAPSNSALSDTIYLTGTGTTVLVLASPIDGEYYDPISAKIDGVTADIVSQGPSHGVFGWRFVAKRDGAFSGTTSVQLQIEDASWSEELTFAAILLDSAEIGDVHSAINAVSYSGTITGGADDIVIWIATSMGGTVPAAPKSGNANLVDSIGPAAFGIDSQLGYGARTLGTWGTNTTGSGADWSITLVNVAGVAPPAPVAVNDAVSFAMSTTGNLVDVLANDTGGIDQTTLTITGGTVASGRRSVVSDGGTYKISVDGPGSVGTETVTYTVDDTSSGTSNVGTLTITWTDPSAVQTVSVQHGVITTGGTSATGTITAVDTARSFARIVASKADFGLAGGNASESFNEFTGKVALTNATTVTASRLASSTTADFRVPYEVWTVDGEAVALRWVGSVTIGSGQTTADSAAISGIDGIGQCVPILTYQQLNSTSRSQGDAAIATVEMIESGGITVRATRGNSTDSLEVGVAVIEFLHDDFVVHKVSGTVGTGSPAAFALGSTVTWDECWYTHSFRAALNSLEEHTVLITELADSGVSRIGVEQYGGNAGTAIVYVVEDAGGGIDSSRVATSTDSNTDGEALGITPVSDVGIATVHVSATLSGTGTAYPRTLYGASLTGSGTVTKYVARTGNVLSYRARVTEWPVKSVATGTVYSVTLTTAASAGLTGSAGMAAAPLFELAPSASISAASSQEIAGAFVTASAPGVSAIADADLGAVFTFDAMQAVGFASDTTVEAAISAGVSTSVMGDAAATFAGSLALWQSHEIRVAAVSDAAGSVGLGSAQGMGASPSSLIDAGATVGAGQSVSTSAGASLADELSTGGSQSMSVAAAGQVASDMAVSSASIAATVADMLADARVDFAGASGAAVQARGIFVAALDGGAMSGASLAQSMAGIEGSWAIEASSGVVIAGAASFAPVITISATDAIALAAGGDLSSSMPIGQSSGAATTLASEIEQALALEQEAAVSNAARMDAADVVPVSAQPGSSVASSISGQGDYFALGQSAGVAVAGTGAFDGRLSLGAESAAVTQAAIDAGAAIELGQTLAESLAASGTTDAMLSIASASQIDIVTELTSVIDAALQIAQSAGVDAVSAAEYSASLTMGASASITHVAALMTDEQIALSSSAEIGATNALLMTGTITLPVSPGADASASSSMDAALRFTAIADVDAVTSINGDELMTLVMRAAIALAATSARDVALRDYVALRGRIGEVNLRGQLGRRTTLRGNVSNRADLRGRIRITIAE